MLYMHCRHTFSSQKNLLVAAAAQVAEAPALEMEATTASMPVGAAALPEAEGGTISVADGRRWPRLKMVERRRGSFHRYDIISIYLPSASAAIASVCK